LILVVKFDRGQLPHQNALNWGKQVDEIVTGELILFLEGERLYQKKSP
jgi:hypothetical protein